MLERFAGVNGEGLWSGVAMVSGSGGFFHDATILGAGFERTSTKLALHESREARNSRKKGCLTCRRKSGAISKKGVRR